MVKPIPQVSEAGENVSERGYWNKKFTALYDQRVVKPIPQVSEAGENVSKRGYWNKIFTTVNDQRVVKPIPQALEDGGKCFWNGLQFLHALQGGEIPQAL